MFVDVLLRRLSSSLSNSRSNSFRVSNCLVFWINLGELALLRLYSSEVVAFNAFISNSFRFVFGMEKMDLDRNYLLTYEADYVSSIFYFLLSRKSPLLSSLIEIILNVSRELLIGIVASISCCQPA